MPWIEEHDSPGADKKQAYAWPILWLQTEVNLCALKKTIPANEHMKNWTYIWKDSLWKPQKSNFLDGKRIWKKPDKYIDIYSMQWEKHQRAWEWEHNRVPPPTTLPPPKDSDLIVYLKEQNIIPDIKNSIVYYVPIEDGKWTVVSYQAMYIPKNSTSEIIKLPVKDVYGKIIRWQTIVRNIPLERPAIDPIDLVCLGWGIWMSFAKWLATLAPKVGINLSKVAVNQISSGALFLQVLWQEISKEAFQQFAQTGVRLADETIKQEEGGS